MDGWVGRWMVSECVFITVFIAWSRTQLFHPPTLKKVGEYSLLVFVLRLGQVRRLNSSGEGFVWGGLVDQATLVVCYIIN